MSLSKNNMETKRKAIAVKDVRKNLRSRLLNKGAKTIYKTAIRNFLSVDDIANAKDIFKSDEKKSEFKSVNSAIAKAYKNNVIHKNKMSRLVSRLSKKIA